MRINGSAYVVDISRSQAVSTEKTTAAEVKAPREPTRLRSVDRVEISPKARELERLKKDMAQYPEVRLDQVALAKQNLQYGGYRVEATYVAQKMMESFDTA
jgi:negative regulator of flagellin synthesis FlgM